ncbi:phospholipid/cholesterol/gamma-HCH transport system substrate-binding protein [Malaciobacter marinus]|jgi:phospholipid/cholesterol/gamma-HCH transport system substrate-binding protein|uniref:Phospholipid/cholesterol/gamma-HCH transport system substrate-binding protein n=1 Tax=Malaciobacter marinus TaxID=505249 RepID=A0AB36ZV65_9BACT|nr:MlaD family protein [Malaciobacter marinus]PPK60372.1 phospholipid/cholesterol/gamma-HCH transport system substrate-binding protein [Malaciobacter marinus]
MQTKINFFKIGTFVIVLFVLMLIFIFWLGKYAFVVTKQDAYTIYFKESVSGLNIDSPVKFKGVQVGKVENISINPKNSQEIKIKISVIENTPIKKDNYATLGTLGLTGLKYIELKGGSKDSNLIQKNKYNEKVIDSKISVLGNLENSSKDISKQLTQLLIQTRILFSNENINNFSELLNASKQTALNTQEITQYIVNNENKLTQILNNLNDLSITSKSSFNNMSESASSVKKSALKVMELSQKILNEVEKGSFDLKTISQSTIDNFNNVLNQFENNLIKSEELIEQLKENPSDILFKNNKQKLGPGE